MVSWAIFVVLITSLGVGAAVMWWRRVELARMAECMQERAKARREGTHEANLQYPKIDLGRCLGCGTCVQSCPEAGVLELIHGQAAVVHGARCVGHGLCAEECPVGAIDVTIGDLTERDDIPVLTPELEVEGRSGIFLGGEVTGFALIRVAIQHGVSIAAEVARRTAGAEGSAGGQRGEAGSVDLCIVGAGPAGLACALEATRRGLSIVVLERESLGGTVASYPRRKLVMTQPVDLPLHGRLKKMSYAKEELMAVWEEVAAKHKLPVRTGVQYQGLEQTADGSWRVLTNEGVLPSRYVCLAIGRRGTPRKLGVLGEELSKVAYSLMDAQSYAGRRVLVVGGGDSAIEAALGLAAQAGNRVTLSYRRASFSRLKSRNLEHIEDAVRSSTIQVLFGSQVKTIEPGRVLLQLGEGGREEWLPNDDVFVLIGGEAPFEMLRQVGVSFSHEEESPIKSVKPPDAGLLTAFTLAFGVSLCAIPWVTSRSDYYALPLLQRIESPQHSILKPSGQVGLAFGLVATILILANLSYLLRRSPRFPLRWGSLRGWMTTHVATGILALLFVVLHSAMAPRSTIGGYALVGLAILAVTGAIGRYFYAFVPRAANGQELALEALNSKMVTLTSEWERDNPAFGARVQKTLESIAGESRLRGYLPSRIVGLFVTQRRTRRSLVELRREGMQEGIAPDQLDRLLVLAKEACRNAFMAAHYEDLRELLATWRFMHRWVALLMFLFVLAHIVFAVRYGGVFP